MEFSHFTLQTMLDDHTSYPNILWSHRLVIALGVAYGLQSFHSQGCVMKDLTATSVLLRSDLSPFLMPVFADLKVDISGTVKENSLNWNVPESHVEGKLLTFKSDLYSFGNILYSLLTRKIPFHGSSRFSIMGKMGGKERSPIPTDQADCPKGYCDLIKQCWSEEPKDRPDLKVVIQSLEAMQLLVTPKIVS